jgi:hypothetical protein
MSLEEAVREAYEIAQTSTDPHDWQFYHALQAVLDARLAEPQTPADTTDIPAPPVSFVRIPRP